ncbi:hypothetical protein D3870_16520 [Noviherbaspirillum cavernae]|uniref:Uncharacterized protein n=1 Tax=Noviherbaspirillum cavernae TaxID=2320862 RepID=A0A418X4P6_9BURK|nr:hypothetical protein D3870_16520 [Noviherbaspirillum cavernae]
MKMPARLRGAGTKCRSTRSGKLAIRIQRPRGLIPAALLAAGVVPVAPVPVPVVPVLAEVGAACAVQVKAGGAVVPELALCAHRTTSLLVVSINHVELPAADPFAPVLPALEVSGTNGSGVLVV